MNTVFMNSENSKTSDPHKLLLNLTDKIDLKVAPTTFGPIKVFKKQSVINISCSFQNFYYTKLAFCHSQ